MTSPTYSKTEARVGIEKLVRTFQQFEPSLTDATEAQIENDYLRPMFRYLNWNVDNTGLSKAEWEFVLQKTDQVGRRPDYLLQIEGQHLLFMDAKRVKHGMHDPRLLYQVYRYAWNTQSNSRPRRVDFAILTDFQEFVTLDCTLKADRPEAVQKFRVIDWRYTDYVPQFDVLWDLFERNQMLSASRDRQSGLWARRLSEKAVKSNRIPPDKAFLKDLDHDKTGGASCSPRT
jgi:hypothetical protein